MYYLFIGIIWLFALNTVRLFLQEVRKRHIEVREWREPNMLPGDFIVRDTIRDMLNPLIVMLIATGILTYFWFFVNWLGLRNFFIILITVTLIFIISCFIATDRITWWAKIKDNYLTINFLNFNFKTLRDISVTDLTIERRKDRIILYTADIRLFSIYTVSEAYDLMVEFLQSNEVPESTFLSRVNTENAKEKKPKEESELEHPPSEIIVRRSKRFLWLLLVLIALNIPIIFIPAEFRTDNIILFAIMRSAIPFIAIITSSFLWKVTSQYPELQFRNRFGRRKSYSFYKISKVDVMAKSYHLFYDSGFNVRRLLIIHAEDKNAKELLAQLADHGIPFYQKGMMVTREDVLHD